jgi:predicted ATPase
MKLKNIEIENFKCFHKAQSFDLARLTILTGANSSGKSSVMYSVLGAIQSGEFPMQFSTNGKYVNMGDFKEIAYRHLSNSRIKINFVFDGKAFEKISTVWVDDKENNLPKLKSLNVTSKFFDFDLKTKDDRYILNFDYYPEKDPDTKSMESNTIKSVISALSSITPDFSTLTDEETGAEVSVNNYKSFEVYLKEMYEKQAIKDLSFDDFDALSRYLRDFDNIRLRKIFSKILHSIKEFDEKVNYISSFRLHPERTYLEKSKSELKVEKFGEGYLDQIIYWQTKKSENFAKLIRIMQNLNLLHDISAERLSGGRYEVQVKTRQHSVSTSLNDVGFGISQFLPIIVADLQLPDDSTLFVAQPEIHLHPSVQASFGDYLVDNIESTDKDYVIETHSEYLLNRIRLAVVKGEIKEADLSIYFIDNGLDEVSVHKIGFAKNGQILNAPDNFFKTYMMDVMEIALNAV